MKRFVLYPLLVLLISSFVRVKADAPTLPSSQLNFFSREGNAIGFNWQAGNGLGRLVIARAGSPVNFTPANGASYNGSTVLGSGDEVAPGQFVIASGGLNQVIVTNLTPGVTYYFAIFEYNGDGAAREYLLSPFLAGNVIAIAPPAQNAANPVVSDITTKEAKLTWNNGDGYGRVILLREGGAVTQEPVNYTSYRLWSEVGAGNLMAYNGTGTGNTNTFTNLKNNTTYHFAIHEYNGNSSPMYARPAVTGSFTTASEPTQAPGNISFHNQDGNRMQAVFNFPGNGPKRLVIARKGSAVTTVPQDGVAYIANGEFAKGSKLGTDEYVVYSGSDITQWVTGLEPATTYHFRVFEFADGGTIDYLTSAFGIGSSSTVTTPTASATNIQLAGTNGTQMSIQYTPGSSTYRAIFMKAGSPVDIVPEQLKKYIANNNFGTPNTEVGNGNFCVALTNSTQPTFYNLTPGVTYHFALFELNGWEAPMYLAPGATFSAQQPITPTQHPNTPVIQNIGLNSMKVYSNAGNGTKQLIIAKEGSPVTTLPVDKKVYAPSWNFGEGEEIAPGEFVIHANTWNAPDVSKLKPNTTYHFRLFTYNELNGEPYYLTTGTPPAISGTTLDYVRPQASNLRFSDIGHTTIKLTFDAGGGTRRFITYKEGAPVDRDPTDFTNYGTGSHIGNNVFVAGIANGTEFIMNNLKAATTYHFAIYEMPASPSIYTRPALTGSASTTGTAQTITFPDLAVKTYGDVDFAPGATASSGLSVTYETSNTNIVQITNGLIQIIGTGSVNITAKQNGDGTYAAATPVTKTLRISGAPLRIAADNKSRLFGEANPSFTYTITGFVKGQTETILTRVPVLNTSATTTSPPGNYTINISGAIAPNYTITHVPGNLEVQPPPRSPQTITFPQISGPLQYGALPFGLGATASSGNPVIYQSGNNAVATVVNGELNIRGAGTVTITANCAGDGQWEDAPPVARTVLITKAPLSIVADDKTMTEGDAVPALTAQYVGFVYNETSTALLTQPVISTAVTSQSIPGRYPIAVRSATSNNYAITMLPGTLTVIPRPRQPQTIAFTAPAGKTYGDAEFDPGATASSGLAVTYSTTTPAVVSIVNNRVRILAAGTASITASQAGDNTYQAAGNVVRGFVVAKAPLEVRADDKTKEEGANNPPLTVTYSGFVNNETESVLTQRSVPATGVTAATPAGIYPIVPGTAIAANYTMNYINGTFTVTARPKQPQSITFAAITDKTYGDANFALNATASSGLGITYTSLSPDVVSIVNGNEVNVLKAGNASIRANQNGDNNWQAAAPVTRNFTVSKATLTITAENKTKVEGQDNPALTFTYSGFVNGDGPSALSTLPLITTTATRSSVPGDYPITPDGAAADNYTFVYIAGTLTVTPAPQQAQTITFPDIAARGYGAADFAANATATSGLGVTLESSNPAVATIVNGNIRITGAGNTEITARQPGNANWLAATPVTRTFTVNKALLTITADNKTKVQGAANPALTATYSGFVNNENASVLTMPVTLQTTATTNSPAGQYPITITGGAAANYTLSLVPGMLTVAPQPKDNVKAWYSGAGTLQIRVYVTAAQQANIVLYGTSGQRIAHISRRLNAGDNALELSLQLPPSGLYILYIGGEKIKLSQNVAIN